jgi:hypothetical protein
MQGHRVVGRLILVGSLLAVGACNRTFKKEAVQPNPLAMPTETLRSSERITIVTGDMELEQPDAVASSKEVEAVHNHHYPLYNQASFTIVSRDRLRFHVQIDHKWQEYADLNTWQVSLEDDSGRHWVPESVEHPKTRIITSMWDREQRTAICNQMGRDGKGDCITSVGYYEDGWKHRQTLGSLSVFRGTADFVFYQRDLFTAAVRSLKLVVRRDGQAFEFKWKFEDTVATE